MDAARWQQVSTQLDALLDLEIPARSTVLARIRADDPPLAAELERLLALAWWRYSIYDLFEAPFDSIEAALDTIEDMVARGAVQPYAGEIATPADLADAETLAARLTPAALASAS